MDRSSAIPDGAPARSQRRLPRRTSTPDPNVTPSTTNTTDSQTSKQSSANNSSTPSPRNSRDSSPTRPPRRAASTNRITSTRSGRTSSIHDQSPSRQMRPGLAHPTTLSRTLSATAAPTLLPAAQEPQIQHPSPQKPTINADFRDGPRWPISPRLRSPPPQSNKPMMPPRRSDQELPAISVQRPTPSPHSADNQQTTSESEAEEPYLPSGLRTPARGPLETVQEVSLPNSPNPPGDSMLVEKIKEKLSNSENHSDTAPNHTHTLRARPSLLTHESGSESGNTRAEARRTTSVPPPLMTRQSSSAMSSRQIKSKQEGSTQTMTVETETVPSVPQVALATGPKTDGTNGTLKTKPSSETIKPKKEKKKSARKQPAVNAGNGELSNLRPGQVRPKPRHHQSRRSSSISGTCLSPTSSWGRFSQDDELGSSQQPSFGAPTQSSVFYPMNTLLTKSRPASSKADIFEAQIASAVDEADTSDSEETFVYDSNPPDTNDRGGRRFHSRTPSATSMVSQADRQNLRSIYGIMEGSAGSAPAPRKNMKFVNTFSNGGDSLTTGEEEGKGSGRSNNGSGRGTGRHHHHIGRWGRQPGSSHTSIFDNESPFPNAARSKLTSHGSRNSSGPPSPRTYHSARNAFSNKRSPMQMSSSYDMDDTTGAEDERTPLIGSVRSARSNRNRRSPHSLRQTESQNFEHRSSYLNRFAACLVLTMMLLLVITGAIGFMFATSQPMAGIELTAIRNVVTSEQVLMFDLSVKAHNPNIVVVTIDHANLEIFAKSEHAGSDSDWWDSPRGPEELHPLDDPVNDPPLDDDDDSKPNVLLGRITEFDSPLTFEGSLFHQGTSESTGQMQLGYPGNQTSGGSRRWERIYQNEFDLIVKGVVKYSLPLSARIRSATVSGRTTVKPNSANDPSLEPNTTTSSLL